MEGSTGTQASATFLQRLLPLGVQISIVFVCNNVNLPFWCDHCK